MTDQDKHALSERMATLAEQAGLPGGLVWERAHRCPQEHPNILGRIAGDLCITCLEKWLGPKTAFVTYQQRWEELETYHENPDWHPDWRIGKQAKDLTNPTHLLPLVEAWRTLNDRADRTLVMYNYCRKGMWHISYTFRDPQTCVWSGDDPDRTVAEALALAAALEDEKGAHSS